MMTKRKDMTEFYMINSFLIALNNLANLQFDVDGYKDLSNKKKEWLRDEVIEWVDKFLME